MGWTRRAIREHVLAEAADLSDTDLTAHVSRCINLARREMCNIRGGKLRFLRKYWDVVTAALDRYVDLPSDLRLIRLVWNLDSGSEVDFLDEDAWRGEHGEQLASDTPGEPAGFLLDSSPNSTTNLKRMEVVPVPDKGYNLRIRGWRKLPDLVDADDEVEITDVPDEYHHGLVKGVRYFVLLHLSKAVDLLAGARREWIEFQAELAATEQDTTLRCLRIRVEAENAREAHRRSVGFEEGEY